MELLRECVHCEIEFDLNSRAKKSAGGKINECPDCVEELNSETAVKYLGVQSDDATLNIMTFKSDEDKALYVETRAHEHTDAGNKESHKGKS